MLNLKKMVSTLLGVTMVANMALSMPAFADETTGCTYAYDGYEVTYDVTNSWGVTEMVSITLSNTGDETIENWMLYFDPNGEITGLFDAQQATTSYGTTYYRNSGYNADVAPNTSVTFSYTVDNCEEIPSDFTLCQTRADKTEGYSVSLRVNQTWGDNNEYFNGEIILENTTDESIEAWELMVDTNFTITEITNSWAATVTELEPYNYLLKGTYTGTVAANSNVSLGFIGVRDGEAEIIDYSLTEEIVDEDAIYNIIYKNYDDDIDWSELIDSDGDRLPDEYEAEYGCDPLNPDSDGDGLPDGYEILMVGSDPINTMSIEDTFTDGEYDSDEDELSNYKEYVLGTNPLVADSDYDGLSDGDEENVYETDPLNSDTDGDSLSDGDEIALGLNPLVADSDGDGVPDNEEMFNQSKTFDADENDTVVQQIDVAFEGTGYIDSTTSVESVMGVDWMCSNVVGLIGDPYDISSDSRVTEGTLTFHVAVDSLGESSFDNLIVLWYNEDEQRFEEMETTRDSSNATLSITTTHFSKYLIVDCDRWYAAWEENNYPDNGNILHTAITIDCSTSTEYTDPNFYRITAANGFVDVMKAADLASVIFFADGADIKQDLTDDKEALHDAINDVFSAGTTNYEAAIQKSMDALSAGSDDTSEDIIIFLSDGAPTKVVDGVGVPISAEDFDYSIIDEAANTGIKIYTVGLGTSTDSNGETILKEIARRTNGDYFYAATAEELIAHFLTINMSKKYDITTDTDDDGLPDLFETYGMPIANGQVIFTDAYDSDVDADGLTDGEEIIMHVVDGEEELHNAYKYMYDYIPEVFISDNGGIYFEVVTDPTNEDTDGDGIVDGNEVVNVTTDARYDNLDPLNVDTIESLFWEINEKSQESNRIKITSYENTILIQPYLVFYGDYADIASDTLASDARTSTLNIIENLGVNCTFKDLFLDGIKNRWSNEYIGTIYDFYPGIVINVEVEPIILENKTSQPHIEVTIHNGVCGVSNTWWYPSFENMSGINMYTSWCNNNEHKNLSNPDCSMYRYQIYNFSTFEGTCAHEYGHAHELGDAYSNANNGYQPISDTSENGEIYYDTGLFAYPGNGEIMMHNGDALANDIEMVLIAYLSNCTQCFVPSVSTSISSAIKSEQRYISNSKIYMWDEEEKYFYEIDN